MENEWFKTIHFWSCGVRECEMANNEKRSHAYITDEEIEAIRQGDELCFERVSVRFSDMIYSRYYGSYNQLEREDYFQEALLCLYHAIITYDARYQAQLTTYYFHLLRNLTINFQRREMSKKRFAAQRPLCFSELGEDDYDYIAQEVACPRQHCPAAYLSACCDFEAACAILSPIEKAALSCLVQDGDLRQLAKDLGVAEKAVKNASYRLKAKIKHFLK